VRSDSLIHDSAWAAAASVVEVFASLLREEEQRRAVFEEVYTRLKAALVRYEEKADRLAKRVKP
jgi:hypothetical protein